MKKNVAAVLVEAVSGLSAMAFWGTMRAVRIAERAGLVRWEDDRLWPSEPVAFSLCLPPREPPGQTVGGTPTATDTGLAPLT